MDQLHVFTWLLSYKSVKWIACMTMNVLVFIDIVPQHRPLHFEIQPKSQFFFLPDLSINKVHSLYFELTSDFQTL